VRLEAAFVDNQKLSRQADTFTIAPKTRSVEKHEMDIFTRFNRKSIDDRQIDTLIGVSKGLLADGKVDPSEAEFLRSWLIQSRSASSHPVISNLLARVNLILGDGILDDEEARELLGTLRLLAGEPSELGEVGKSASLPICKPAPDVVFAGKSFLFTGTCVYGTRKQVQGATERLGGTCAASVTKALNYLVLGTYVTDSWVHETFGRKIERAMAYRDDGVPIAIISEERWADAGNL
jgi:NAD-dependent DNA ligase